MPEKTEEKGRIWEDKRECSYCHKVHSGEDLGFVHRNKDEHVDWSICFPCTKRFFDKSLGKETKIKEVLEKCSYCNIDREKYFLHVDANNDLVWYACFECTKKAFGKVLKGEK